MSQRVPPSIVSFVRVILMIILDITHTVYSRSALGFLLLKLFNIKAEPEMSTLCSILSLFSNLKRSRHKGLSMVRLLV